MKHYTTLDYKILRESLSAEILILTINGVKRAIQSKYLHEKIFNLKKVKGEYPKKGNLCRFLHSVPLHRVPLYLNSFLELATWRLKIGK
jgi:hypothetical protein